MQMATLKTSNELQQVAEQVNQRGLGKIKGADFGFEIFNFSRCCSDWFLVVGI
jgi:hypothetical protein